VEHLHHFQLSDDPFRNEPVMRMFFDGGPQQDALRRLDRAVRQGRGLSLLVGAAGSGKTMTVRRLFEDLEEDVFEASMMVVLAGAADAQWMLRRYALQLGVEEPAQEREGLIAQIYEQLAIVREDGRHAVLIIDDAHALMGQQALDEICGLLKLEYEDRRLLSIVLAGTRELDDTFGSDHTLAHRIDVRVKLTPFSPEASDQYLDHRIRQVAGHPTILENDAIAALHELGDGYPGRINTLADNALFEAFLCGRRQMTRLDVERAHADLGWSRTSSAPEAVAAAALKPPTPQAMPKSDPAEESSGDLSDSFRDTLDELDPELAAVFKPAPDLDGPPKDEPSEAEDLLVELVED
jgi:type II secretory pathway predicted ATPase ExeA